MKTIAIIPARYESSRFPGKPLADICGKPMLYWVYQNAKAVKMLSEVYVATDSEKILEVCGHYGMKCIMTSSDCLTGTDRVAEAAKELKADVFINIQGDEPLLEPETISKALEPFLEDNDVQITNLMTRITNPVDLVNANVPKVIIDESGMGLFLTRASAPYPKGSLEVDYFKQVCVYGFRPSALKFFGDYGRAKGKAKIEKIEDIEILRFIENGYRIKYIEVQSETVAVDTPKDLKRVRVLMDKRLRGGGQAKVD